MSSRVPRHEDTPPNRTTHPDPSPVDPRTWARESEFESERPTPVRPHPRPSPVVCPPLRAPHSHAPLPGPAPRASLADLGLRRRTPLGLGDPFPADEAPTPTRGTDEAALAREAARLVRNWRACPPDRRKQISRMALQYREDAEGRDR